MSEKQMDGVCRELPERARAEMVSRPVGERKEAMNKENTITLTLNEFNVFVAALKNPYSEGYCVLCGKLITEPHTEGCKVQELWDFLRPMYERKKQ